VMHDCDGPSCGVLAGTREYARYALHEQGCNCGLCVNALRV
jgi:hypothetical protein